MYIFYLCACIEEDLDACCLAVFSGPVESRFSIFRACIERSALIKGDAGLIMRR